ncbi:hypothetical protein [Helicobacter himalayensis]|uniref:hypothetical protein n=1 Tax=Helicobacter himalayensis TaxID=1591088 RepID=UPI000831CD39|nr:hypothetical protein [Helicobacter himalayensis]
MRGLQENAKRHARGQKATNQATNRDTKEITKESREQGDKAHKATITPPPPRPSQALSFHYISIKSNDKATTTSRLNNLKHYKQNKKSQNTKPHHAKHLSSKPYLFFPIFLFSSYTPALSQSNDLSMYCDTATRTQNRCDINRAFNVRQTFTNQIGTADTYLTINANINASGWSRVSFITNNDTTSAFYLTVQQGASLNNTNVRGTTVFGSVRNTTSIIENHGKIGMGNSTSTTWDRDAQRSMGASGNLTMTNSVTGQVARITVSYGSHTISNQGIFNEIAIQAGSTANITNAGTITALISSSTIANLTNQNNGRIATLTNTGAITTLNNQNNATITTLTNQQGAEITTLNNQGTITTLNNNNSATLATLNNQGTINTFSISGGNLRQGTNSGNIGTFTVADNQNQGINAVVTSFTNQQGGRITTLTNQQGGEIQTLTNEGTITTLTKQMDA